MSRSSKELPLELDAGEFIRLPGLFRRWELPDVIEVGPDFHFEEAGSASDGTELFAVYRRTPFQEQEE
jgi:hypothetical protein